MSFHVNLGEGRSSSLQAVPSFCQGSRQLSLHRTGQRGYEETLGCFCQAPRTQRPGEGWKGWAELAICLFLYIGGPSCGCPDNESPILFGVYTRAVILDVPVW